MPLRVSNNERSFFDWARLPVRLGLHHFTLCSKTKNSAGELKSTAERSHHHLKQEIHIPASLKRGDDLIIVRCRDEIGLFEFRSRVLIGELRLEIGDLRSKLPNKIIVWTQTGLFDFSCCILIILVGEKQ